MKLISINAGLTVDRGTCFFVVAYWELIEIDASSLPVLITAAKMENIFDVIIILKAVNEYLSIFLLVLNRLQEQKFYMKNNLNGGLHCYVGQSCHCFIASLSHDLLWCGVKNILVQKLWCYKILHSFCYFNFIVDIHLNMSCIKNSE